MQETVAEGMEESSRDARDSTAEALQSTVSGTAGATAGGAEAARIAVNEAWRLVQSGADPLFLDTRNLKHYAQSDLKIPGSLRIWREELEERIGELPRDHMIIAYCKCHKENSSGKATLILNTHGFSEVFALLGGIDAWRDEGLPLVPKEV
jgi:rhodanese-related sulfurtransferase